MLGLRAHQHGLAFLAIEEAHPHPLGPGHHMQVGQDGAVVDDDHAGAQAAFHGALFGVVFAVVLVVHQAHHAHYRWQDGFVGGSGLRGQRFLFQRLTHRGVDVVLRDHMHAWAQLQQAQHQCQSEQRASHGP